MSWQKGGSHLTDCVECFISSFVNQYYMEEEKYHRECNPYGWVNNVLRSKDRLLYTHAQRLHSSQHPSLVGSHQRHPPLPTRHSHDSVFLLPETCRPTFQRRFLLSAYKLWIIMLVLSWTIFQMLSAGARGIFLTQLRMFTWLTAYTSTLRGNIIYIEVIRAPFWKACPFFRFILLVMGKFFCFVLSWCV